MRRSGLYLLAVILSLAIAGAAQTGKPKQAAASTGGNEAEVRALYERWARAFRARDLDAIMAVYAPGSEVVAYDIVPPLEYRGNASYRKDYAEFMAQYDGPIEVEFREMRVVAGNDVAFVHALERIAGKLKNGQRSEVWLRATSGLRKINGKWLIVHDHISVPADMNSGKAELGLKP